MLNSYAYSFDLKNIWSTFQVGQEVYLRSQGICMVKGFDENGLIIRPHGGVADLVENDPTAVGIVLDSLLAYKQGIEVTNDNGELGTVVNVYSNGAILYRQKDNSVKLGEISNMGYPIPENDRVKINDEIIFILNKSISSGKVLQIFSNRMVLVRDTFNKGKRLVYESNIGLPTTKFLDYEVDANIICDSRKSGKITAVYDNIGVEFVETTSDQIDFCSYDNISFESLPYSKLRKGSRVLTENGRRGVVVSTFENGRIEVELDATNRREFFWASTLSTRVDQIGEYVSGKIINGESSREYEIIELFGNGKCACRRTYNNEVSIFSIFGNQQEIESDLVGTKVLAKESQYRILKGEIVKALTRGNFKIQSRNEVYFTDYVGFKTSSLAGIDESSMVLYRDHRYSPFKETRVTGVYTNGYLTVDFDGDERVVHISDVRKL